MMNKMDMSMLDAIKTSPANMAVYFRGPKIAIVFVAPPLDTRSFWGSTWIYDLQTARMLPASHGLLPLAEQEIYKEQKHMLSELQQAGIPTDHGWVPVYDEVCDTEQQVTTPAKIWFQPPSIE